VGVSQTAALNRVRHLYSAGRPSRWALAHISSLFYEALKNPQRGSSIDAQATQCENVSRSHFVDIWICSSCGFELWPMTWPSLNQDEPPCRTSRSKVISFESYYTIKNTYRRLIALPVQNVMISNSRKARTGDDSGSYIGLAAAYETDRQAYRSIMPTIKHGRRTRSINTWHPLNDVDCWRHFNKLSTKLVNIYFESRQIGLPKTDDLVPVRAAYVIISCTQQEGMRGERAYIHLPNRLLAALHLVRPGYTTVLRFASQGWVLLAELLTAVSLACWQCKAIDHGHIQRFDMSTEQPEPGVVPITPLGDRRLYGWKCNRPTLEFF